MLRLTCITLVAVAGLAVMPAAAEQCPAPRESAATEFGDHRRPMTRINHTDRRNSSYIGHDFGRTPRFVAAFQRFRLVREVGTSGGGWTLTCETSSNASCRLFVPPISPRQVQPQVCGRASSRPEK